MKRTLFFSVLLTSLLLGSGCVGDLITLDETEEEEETTLEDPGLSWSASSYEATLGTDNSFPTLTNESGVSVSYSSSDDAVATISSDGTVTLVATGSATITAASEETSAYEAASVSYSLTVVKGSAGVAWSAETANVVLGSDYELPTLTNENGLEISYSSSDESVATIASDGTVTIIADGTTTITAAWDETDTYESGSALYTLTISKSTDGISWSTNSCTVTIGASDNSFPTLNNPGEQSITYSSTNTGVATIASDGTVTLVAAGATTITAVSEENDNYSASTASYSLTVQEEGSNLKSAGLEWPATEYSATLGSDFSSPTLTNPNKLSVTYSSSDESVATISSGGTVTLVAAGTTTITAESAATDTYAAGSAYYTLTVSKADAGLAWSASSYTATFGADNSFPTLTNDNDLKVTYASSDESVATISSSGTVTLVAAGTTGISATYAGDDTYASTTVTYTLKVSKGTATLSWSASSCSVNLSDSSAEYPTLTVSPSGLSISYSSSDTSVATISSSGKVTAVAKGSATISATFDGDDTYSAASASYSLSVTDGSDDGAVSMSFDSAGDTSSDDDISNTTFTRLVTVTYSTSGASVSGYSAVSDVFDVDVSGNEVTITYSGSENVVYKLTGTASDGFFKLYSSKKQALWLSGVSITSSDGAAINNQSGKRTFVYVDGTNTLADTSSAAYSTSGDEDMKGVFFSEGQLVFSGSGSLTVTANNKQSKSGIVSDDYVRLMSSPTVKVTAGSSAGHGIRGNEYVQISNGTLTVSTSAAMKKGVGSDGYVLVEGGSSTITVSGGVAYDSDDAEYKGTAGIKADNYFAMTGGTVTITNTGSGGKGVSAGSYDYYSENGSLDTSYISGGTLTVKTTGSESNDVSSKAIKIGFKQSSGSSYIYAGDLKISGGAITVNCSKSEGLEAKGDLTISGGETYVYSTGDDAINAQGEISVSGGYVYAYSTANDGIDSNGNTTLSGGYVFAITTKGSPEVAFDTNTEGGCKLYVKSGATMVAYGGLESGYSASQTIYSMSCSAGNWNALHNGSSYIAAFKAPSGISSVAVSAPSLSKGYTGVTASSSVCNGTWAASSNVSGGSAVSLSSYGGGNSGGTPGGGGGNSGGGPGGGR
ncbi:MAG: carbohydrate-binding domain-containing protein [Bacteroidales bacterium]|nr:carbohydrate-binding domain-containing protein [Bacteroidales bacterium]